MQTTATVQVATVKPKMGCAYVLAVVLAGTAVALLLVARNLYLAAGQNLTPAVVVASLLGLGLLALMAPYMSYSRRIVRESAEAEERRLQFPGQPWKW